MRFLSRKSRIDQQDRLRFQVQMVHLFNVRVYNYIFEIRVDGIVVTSILSCSYMAI